MAAEEVKGKKSLSACKGTAGEQLILILILILILSLYLSRSSLLSSLFSFFLLIFFLSSLSLFGWLDLQL